MKRINIRLEKTPIFDYIDGATYKRVDAELPDRNTRTQDAVASDSEDTADAFLINEYCNRRDARLRARLKFCLIDTSAPGDVLTFDNTDVASDEYQYFMQVDDSFTSNDVKSLGTLMDSYIKRGAILDWYRHMHLEPTDTEIEINELEDAIVSSLRGQAWGRRPPQPFGPACFNFYRKRF